MLYKIGLGMGRFGRGNMARHISAPKERFFSLFFEWSSLRCSTRTDAHTRRLSTSIHRSRGSPTRQLHTCTPIHQQRMYTSPVEAVSIEPSNQPNDTSKAPNTASLGDTLRQTMRNMPHSVAVVTSSSNTRHKLQRYKGMTVSSFTTLTLTPEPIITFNITSPSKTLDAIIESKQFIVHLLEATKFGANIADVFASGHQTAKFRNNRFRASVKDGSGSLAPPRLTEQSGDEIAMGIAKGIVCRLVEEKEGGLVKVGDHVIVLGRVVEVYDGEK